MTKAKGSYTIQAKLDLLAGLTISADSLEDALEKANKLKEEDFVEFADEYVDGSMKLTGIFEN
jgi:hypothetical protein